MQCKCGGRMTDKVESYGRAVLNFKRCVACGRISSEALVFDGEIIARWNEARTMFNDITSQPYAEYAPPITLPQ